MLEIRNSIRSEWFSSAPRSAGLMPRHISHSQKVSPHEQQDLPETAQVDIFVTLRAQPEPQIAELLLDAHPFTGKRSDDHGNQRDEKTLTPSLCPFGSAPLTAGTMYRPVASHEVAIQKMPICKCQVRATDTAATSQAEFRRNLAFDAVMSDDRPQRYLHHPERSHHEEVLDCSFLRGRGLQPEQRIALRHDACRTARDPAKRNTRPCRRRPPAAGQN